MENSNDKFKDLEILADLMDDKFEVFGFRFGLSFIINLVPAIGDLTATLIALYIFHKALQFNISKITIVRMLFNIFVYFIIGLVPLIGDFFSALWKPNKRNLKLLRRKLIV
jgi:hypothetical protein